MLSRRQLLLVPSLCVWCFSSVGFLDRGFVMYVDSFIYTYRIMMCDHKGLQGCDVLSKASISVIVLIMN